MPSSQERKDARPWFRRLWSLVAGLALLVGLAVGLLTLRDRYGGSSTSPAARPPSETATSETAAPPTRAFNSRRLARQVIAALPACARLPPDSPLAQELASHQAVVVDARCDTEDPSRFIGVYPAPSQAGRALGEVPTQRYIDNACRVVGQKVKDYGDHSSNVWVRFDYRGLNGEIPAVWTQGADGLPACDCPEAPPATIKSGTNKRGT